MFNPSYTNYDAVGLRIGRKTATVERELNEMASLNCHPLETVGTTHYRYKTGCVAHHSYDNPTGQLFSKETLIEYTKIKCVKHNLWIISDEAYPRIGLRKRERNI